ncbi:HD domain-containing phosphohydrolase [Rubellimicrobium roseum]|uniref:Response regulator n=1 Tax=Rubellimicrobium roseum TaxID=687525 RepID=A0A5C4NFI5_9RHOB|nr:HD domain-containing phosphohydrolase [Rubellimicrobium roseum]TNC70890.1 response regulator [Rubellimicrobium roseum]
MDLCVIDDHRVNLGVLRGVIESVSDWRAEAFSDPLAALDRCARKVFDLVVVDYQMPGLDGVGVVRRLRADPRFEHVPIVMITADGDRALRIEAIRAGATDFLTKPVDPEELRVRVANLLALRQAQTALADHAVHLAQEVAAATRRIAQREEEVILRLARAIEYRDDQTGDHILRVARVSALIAAELGWGPAACRNLFLAAQLHDAGKIGLPDSILLKPGRLSPEEIDVMRRHAVMGGEVLRDGTSDLIRLAHDVALYHHERWDGSGYPHGLAGERIPLSARIAAVADVLDALRSARPYKPAWDAAQARAEIERLAGIAFDPSCVAALLRIWPAAEALYSEIPNPLQETMA